MKLTIWLMIFLQVTTLATAMETPLPSYQECDARFTATPIQRRATQIWQRWAEQSEGLLQLMAQASTERTITTALAELDQLLMLFGQLLQERASGVDFSISFSEDRAELWAELLGQIQTQWSQWPGLAQGWNETHVDLPWPLLFTHLQRLRLFFADRALAMPILACQKRTHRYLDEGDFGRVMAFLRLGQRGPNQRASTESADFKMTTVLSNLLLVPQSTWELSGPPFQLIWRDGPQTKRWPLAEFVTQVNWQILSLDYHEQLLPQESEALEQFVKAPTQVQAFLRGDHQHLSPACPNGCRLDAAKRRDWLQQLLWQTAWLSSAWQKMPLVQASSRQVLWWPLEDATQVQQIISGMEQGRSSRHEQTFTFATDRPLGQTPLGRDWPGLVFVWADQVKARALPPLAVGPYAFNAWLAPGTFTYRTYQKIAWPRGEGSGEITLIGDGGV